MLLAFMSDVKISTQEMMNITGVQTNNSKPALTRSVKARHDLFAFDSIIKDMKARVTETKKDHSYKTVEAYSENTFNNDRINQRIKTISDRRHDQKNKEIGKKPERSESISADQKKHEQGSEGVNKRSGETNKLSKENQTKQHDMNAKESNNENSQSKFLPENDKGNYLKADASLSDLLNLQEAEIKLNELIDDAALIMDETGEAITSNDAVTDSDNMSVSNISGGDPKGTINNSLLSNGNSSVQEEGDSKTADALNRMFDSNKSGTLKNDISMDASLTEASEKETTDKNISTDEKMAVPKIKEAQIETDNFEEALKEVAEKSDDDSKKVKLGNARNYQSLDSTDFDVGEVINNDKMLNDRPVSQFMQNLTNNASALRHFTVNHVETGSGGSEANDNSHNSMLNHSNVSHESGKLSGILKTENTTRPSGFNELIDKIVYVVKGNNRLGVTVEHENLGRLNINLSMEKGMVNVHINTSDSAVKELVENNIQQIIDSLFKNGVSIGGFSIGFRNHKNGDSNAHKNRNENAYSVDSVKEKDYCEANTNSGGHNGRVNIIV